MKNDVKDLFQFLIGIINPSLNASSPWYWWLRTPNAGNSHGARNVLTDGTLSSYDAYGGYYGVRPAFRLESGIEIVLEEDEVNLSDSALLEGFTTRQLVEELFRRADRNESLLDQGGEDNEDDDF